MKSVKIKKNTSRAWVRYLPLFVLVPFSIALGQPRQHRPTNPMFALPPFAFEIYQFPGNEPGTTRVEIHTGLVNDVLQFVRTKDGTFKAGYQWAIDIVDEDGKYIADKILNRKTVLNRFDETNSRTEYTREFVAFNLAPGKYKFLLNIEDTETKKHLRREQPVEIRSFPPDELQVSSIVFLSAMAKGAEDSLAYNLAKTYNRPDEKIPLEFVLSGLAPGDSAQIHYELHGWDDQKIATWDEGVFADSSAYRVTRSIRQYLKGTGTFALVIRASQNGKRAEQRESFSVNFIPIMPSADDSTENSNANIGPYEYILSKGDFKKLAKADSAGRKALVDDFWARRNPDPKASENELRKEFDRRVQFANKHFSVLSLQKQGWQTDRGRIYIKYGQPTWVRNQAQQKSGQFLEVWYYSQMNTHFVFQDKKGNGDFALIVQE